MNEKNNSYVIESDQSFTTINSSVSDIVKALDDYDWSQIEENATTPLDLVNGSDIKQKVTPSELIKTSYNDNFEDLKEQISMETLDLIRRLHMRYLDTEYLMKQPESSSSGKSKSKKEEIIYVSGKLEIL